MSASPSIDAPAPKIRKTPPSLRKPQILALQAAGLTQNEIASKLGVSRSAIVKDLQEIRPAKQALDSKLETLMGEIAVLLPTKERAREYASLAVNAKNEAVRLGTLQRIDDLDGIVTEKELVRSKRNEPAAPTAMFMLPPGASISVTTSVTPKNVTPHVTHDVEILPEDPHS